MCTYPSIVLYCASYIQVLFYTVLPRIYLLSNIPVRKTKELVLCTKYAQHI